MDELIVTLWINCSAWVTAIFFPLCAGGKPKGDKGAKGKDGGKGKKKKGGKADSLPKIVPVSELSCCVRTWSHPSGSC